MGRRIPNTEPRTFVRRARRSGFTLAESLIASVVLAASVIGISGALSASYQQTQSVDETSVAMSLARELMEEISAKQFVDPDVAEGSHTTRATRDNIADYHNYTDQSTALPLINGTTRNVTGTAVYTRLVTVIFGTRPAAVAASADANDFATVTVTVTTPTNKKVAISRLMTNVKIAR